jgi:hypothetical protein
MINRLTDEQILPVSTANQYQARYWFEVRAGKISSQVRPDIGSRVALVKLVHQSGDLSVRPCGTGGLGQTPSSRVSWLHLSDLCTLLCGCRESLCSVFFSST